MEEQIQILKKRQEEYAKICKKYVDRPDLVAIITESYLKWLQFQQMKIQK